MQGKAGLVLFLGGGLIIANSWSNGTIQDLASGQIQNSTTPNHKWYQTPWGQIGYEALGVMVGTVIANASDEGGSAVVVFFVVLWVLYLINTVGKPASSGSVASKIVTQAPTSVNAATTGQVSGASLGTGGGPGGPGSGYNPSPSGNAYTLPRNPGRSGYTIAPGTNVNNGT